LVNNIATDMLCYKTSGYIASKYRSGYKKEYGIATNFFCCCMVYSVVAINVAHIEEYLKMRKKKPYMELERGLKEQTYKH
jgi:hypothetical protein